MDSWNACCSIWSALGTCAEEFFCSTHRSSSGLGVFLENVRKISSIDELRIFLHARHCCQSMNRGDRECWEETVFFNWAGEEVRGDIDAEMALSTFLIRIPFQITIYVSWGARGDGKKVHCLLANYVVSQSIWQLQRKWWWTEVHILQHVVYRLIGVYGFTSK